MKFLLVEKRHSCMIDRDKLFCKRILMFLPKNVYYDGCRQNKLIACKMSENVVQRKGKF